MTEPDRKFEEEIRRALCAASDLIVPAGDGLNLIRERAARRPPALRRLPLRQREALVLRYYLDLSEAQIASAMGISRGAVKSHTARGMSSLRTVLKMEV